MALSNSASALKIKSGSPFTTVIKAGMTAGVLDALAAILLNLNINPLRIFRFIASGVLGNAAFEGGLFTAFLGLIFHLGIVHIWALIFFIVYPRVKILSKNVYLTGLFYGVIVWLMMNLIVVPLSSTPPLPSTTIGAVKGIIVIMICVGLPIALIVKKYYQQEKPAI